ncbi:MAG: hypothetical protein Q4G16_00495 [Cruoricaptor ignavus]|nr:hypothetical protein [Cruoricaptor ignavus]
MNKIIISLSILISSIAFSQVIIGSGKTALSGNSVSLEFGNENKGLILPWVNDISSITNAANGTMALDITTRMVKVKLNNEWMELSKASTSLINTTLQDPYSDKENAKVSIGEKIIETPGILVLEDENKAMILPSLESPHLNIIKPSAGMIAYDTKTKLLCVYNGTEWAFWKAE